MNTNHIPSVVRMVHPALALAVVLPSLALAQPRPVPRPPAPYMPPAAAPGSQPNMLINPPPATFSGPWRPEYGAMIAPPWAQKP